MKVVKTRKHYTLTEAERQAVHDYRDQHRLAWPDMLAIINKGGETMALSTFMKAMHPNGQGHERTIYKIRKALAHLPADPLPLLKQKTTPAAAPDPKYPEFEPAGNRDGNAAESRQDAAESRQNRDSSPSTEAPTPPPTAAPGRAMSLLEVAEVLEVGRTRIYEIQQAGELDAFELNPRIGGVPRYSRALIEAWLNGEVIVKRTPPPVPAPTLSPTTHIVRPRALSFGAKRGHRHKQG